MKQGLVRSGVCVAAVLASVGLNAAAPASAATSVTPGPVSVVPATAGSNASYTIPFTVASALPAGGTITLVAPPGTDFLSCTTAANCSGVYSVSVNNGHAATISAVASTSTGASTDPRNQAVITLATSTIAAGDLVTVSSDNATTNPQKASSDYTISESTSADSAPASSPAYTITASTPASVVATEGSGQSAQVGKAFTTPLQAAVTDAYGNPVPGVVVTFTAPSSGPSGTFSASGCPADTNPTPAYKCMVTTDSSGLATAGTFTANSTSGGPYTVTATEPDTQSSASFSLTNTATPVVTVTGGPVTLSNTTEGATSTYTIKFTAGDAVANGGTVTLVAPAGTTFPAPSCSPVPTTPCTNPTLTYTTASNSTPSANIADGATVTGGNQIVITAGSLFDGASIPAGAAVTVTVTGVTNPTAASQSYTIAESDSADTTAVSSNEYAVTPGPATQLAVVAATNDQSATVGTQYPSRLQVTARDAQGNLELAGTKITFSLVDSSGSPGGTFPGGSITQTNLTDGTGTATSSPVIANGTAGAWSATATITGSSTSANFSLTNDAGPPANVAITAGDNQTEPVGTAYPVKLSVTVTDSFGNPVPGTGVVFTSPSISNGTFATCGNNSTSTVCNETTDSSGAATSSTLTAGSAVGTFAVSVTAGKATNNFSETNVAGPGNQISIVSGDNQDAVVNTAFPQPLVVQVTDRFGNPVAGDTVTFAAPSSGASGSFANCPGGPGGPSCTATTDSNGKATASNYVANGQSGTDVVTATDTTSSFTGTTNSVSFSLENLSGTPGSITPTGGTSPQSAQVGASFAPLQALVRDNSSSANPMPGVFVTFTAPSGSGTFANGKATETDQTNSSGIATSSVFTASHQAESYTITATPSGASSPSGTFQLTNLPGPATNLALPSSNSGSSQTAAAGGTFAAPLEALVTDQYGNPVSGTAVTFTFPTSGPTATFSASMCSGNVKSTPAGECIVNSNADGLATTPQLTASTTAGSFQPTATAAGLSGSPVQYTLTVTPAGASKITVESGQNQSAEAGKTFSSPVVVEVFDQYGNPVPGATVAFGTPNSGGPSGVFAGNSPNYVTVTSNQSGLATSPTFSANDTSGQWQMGTEVVGDPATATFVPETNTPDTVDGATVTVVAGTTGESAHVGWTFAQSPAVKVADRFGNPIPGVSVTFTLPVTDPDGTFPGTAGPSSTASTATATSGVTGVATAPTLRAGLRPGIWNASASATVNSVTYHATFTFGDTDGYLLASPDGSVQAFGDASYLGSPAGLKLAAPVVGIAADPVAPGYVLAGADGGVFAYPSSLFHGSAYGQVPSSTPVVGVAFTPDGQGYYLVASNGKVYNFGTAKAYGDASNLKLAAPVVGMAVAPNDAGYWLVAADGGVFSYPSSLPFYGSEGGVKLNQPVVGMAVGPGGMGYWLVAADGGVFTHGDATFYGSAFGLVSAPVVGMAADPSGTGYWLVSKDGGVFTFGSKSGPPTPFYGSGYGSGKPPVVGMTDG